MRAGKLRHKVGLYVPVQGVSAVGEIEVTNALLGTYYADVYSTTGNETNNLGTLTSTITYRVTLRYNKSDLTDIDTSGYILFDGRKLLINSVAFRDSRRRMIDIIATEAR
jgi:SPP1 family predicted phage head-tail adaptor